SVAISVLMFSKEINSDNTYYKSRSCTQFNYNKETKIYSLGKVCAELSYGPFPTDRRLIAPLCPLPLPPSSSRVGTSKKEIVSSWK
ncbi:hypothetical protein ACQP3C_29390, partial [Escherichia coli]